MLNEAPYKEQPSEQKEIPIRKGIGRTRQTFSKFEDEKLKELVMQHGERNWGTIAACMKNRTAHQCRERYKNHLSPKIKNDPWSQEEETFLERMYAEYGPKWSKIARFFSSRSDLNIKNHWNTMINRRSREQRIFREKNNYYQRIDSTIENYIVPPIPNYPYETVQYQQPYEIVHTIPVVPIQYIAVPYPVFQNGYTYQYYYYK